MMSMACTKLEVITKVAACSAGSSPPSMFAAIREHSIRLCAGLFPKAVVMAALQALPFGHKYNGVNPARGRSNGAAANYILLNRLHSIVDSKRV